MNNYSLNISGETDMATFPKLVIDEKILAMLDEPTKNPAPKTHMDDTEVPAKPRELRIGEDGTMYMAQVRFGRTKWFIPEESPNMESEAEVKGEKEEAEKTEPEKTEPEKTEPEVKEEEKAPAKKPAAKRAPRKTAAKKTAQPTE